MVRMHRKYLTVLIVVFGSAFLTFLYIFKPLYYDETSVGYDENKAALTADEIQNQFINELVQRTDIEEFKKILKPILVERVVGTSNHERVKDYIAAEMRNLNWDVELDAFPDVTPNKGELLFTNIIATNNPSASRFLVFACHYDSKMMNFTFIGATDSAVPCAMLIYFAKVLQRTLRNVQSPVGLKFIFFDGEEAFVAWSDKDSVYGARHLASLMESRSNLNQIELMVLLDLIGDSSPQFYSYFSNTHRWYRMLVSIEKLLGSKRLLLPETPPVRYFTNSKFFGADIKDDHEPFLVKGVPVLHIIPLPFPNVWHTEFDNESVINYNTVKNLLLIFEVFIVQYLTDPSLIAAV